MTTDNLIIAEGMCPICGSENITYGVLEPYGEGIYYPAICDDCGATFKECYNLTFDTHIDICPNTWASQEFRKNTTWQDK